MRVGFLACVKAKRPYATQARSLYCSPLFHAASSYAEHSYDAWYILSAKYGLVHPDTVIEPYDLTLNDMPIEARREWGEKVLLQVQRENLCSATVYLHAGQRYREFLETPLHADVPLRGLGIGQQLAWYKARLCEF